MSKPNQKNEKLKVALIPVLGLVLLFVLLGGESKSHSPVPELVTTGTATPEFVAASPSRPVAERRIVTWPQHSLADILRHNPLNLSDPRAMLESDFKANGFHQDVEMATISAEEFFFEEPSAEELLAAEHAIAQQQPVDDGTEIESAKKSGYAASVSSPEQAVAVMDAAVLATQAEEAKRELEVATQLAAEEAAREQRAADEANAVAALNQRLNAIRNIPVLMYMKTAKGHSALLGDRVISEGEFVEDDIRVASITRMGITFEVVSQSLPETKSDQRPQ